MYDRVPQHHAATAVYPKCLLALAQHRVLAAVSVLGVYPLGFRLVSFCLLSFPLVVSFVCSELACINVIIRIFICGSFFWRNVHQVSHS